jgi:hypothetical protein
MLCTSLRQHGCTPADSYRYRLMSESKAGSHSEHEQNGYFGGESRVRGPLAFSRVVFPVTDHGSQRHQSAGQDPAAKPDIEHRADCSP